MNILSTALGITFYYKILHIRTGLAPNLWAPAPPPNTDLQVCGEGVSEGSDDQN